MSRASRARAALARQTGRTDTEKPLLSEAASFMLRRSGTEASRLVERLYFALVARRRRDLPTDLPVLTQEALGALGRRREAQLLSDPARSNGTVIEHVASGDERRAQRATVHAEVTAAYERAIASQPTASGSNEHLTRNFLDLAAAAMRAAEVATEAQGLRQLIHE